MTNKKASRKNAVMRLVVVLLAVSLPIILGGAACHTDTLCSECQEPISGGHSFLACNVHRTCSPNSDDSSHTEKCKYCNDYLCKSSYHGPGGCNNERDAMPTAPRPTPSPNAPCDNCKEMLGYSESHAAPCKIADHFTCDGADHSDAPCGADGHLACDGQNHNAAACGTAGHLACDGTDHGSAPCNIGGHLICDGTAHTKDACGHYICADGFQAESHQAMDCGLHFHCDESAYAYDHFLCEHCGEYMCAEGNRETHGFYDCGWGNHYHCGGYDVAGGDGGYTHVLYPCQEHSDCSILEMPDMCADPNLHYDCEECSFCVARGHAPGCSQYTGD